MNVKFYQKARVWVLTACLILSSMVNAQKKWTSNIGMEAGGDFYTGMGGLSTLKANENPLVKSDLKEQYFVTAGIYSEFLKLVSKNSEQGYDIRKPSYGFKTGLNWSFYRADNSSNGGGESLGLNYINLPILFEICLGYHQGVTRGGNTPESYSVSTYEHSYGDHTIITHTPGGHINGGRKISTGTLLYTGPEMGYLFKSFNYIGDPITNPNLNKNNMGWKTGITFWMDRLSFDFSYLVGLSSVYNGKNIPINAFALKFGINFNDRLYKKN